MNTTDTYDPFATAFDYPIDRDEIIDTAGDTDIEAPTGAPDSVAAVLERTETRTFRSPRELHETILCNLGEQYIGRKNYDDRGTNFERAANETI
jgi:hypothetical protein